MTEEPMNKSAYLLSAAALAASALPAAASVPLVAPGDERPAVLAAARASGLTAADLTVGRDGAVAVQVSAPTIKVADTGGQNGC
jgi:hypothetical protein